MLAAISLPSRRPSTGSIRDCDLIGKLLVAEWVLRRTFGELHVTLKATTVAEHDLEGRIIARRDGAVVHQGRGRHQPPDLGSPVRGGSN